MKWDIGIYKPHFQAKGRITAEEREKFVLIFLSFNGQLDYVFNDKSEDFYLVILIAFMDEQQEDSRAVALCNNDIKLYCNHS